MPDLHPVQGRWLIVIVVCVVYLAVRWFADQGNDLAALLCRWWAFPPLIAFAVLLAALEALALIP